MKRRLEPAGWHEEIVERGVCGPVIRKRSQKYAVKHLAVVGREDAQELVGVHFLCSVKRRLKRVPHNFNHVLNTPNRV